MGVKIAATVFVITFLLGAFVKLTVPMTPNEYMANMWPDMLVGVLAAIYLAVRWRNDEPHS